MGKKVVIDVDTGVDDAEAIMLALGLQDVEVVVITCVAGNVGLDNVCRNTLRVLKVCERLDVPVFRGAEKAIVADNGRAPHYHGNDGLGDAPNPEEVDMSLIQGEHAVNALMRIVKENPGDITLVAVAPLTNIALAIRLYPDFGKNLKELYVMGGNTDGKGGDCLAAEFNFATDPEAAYITLNELKSPITIVSYETTKLLGVDWEWFDKWVSVDTAKGCFHKAFCRMTAERNRNVYKRIDYASCDLLAMAIALDTRVITDSVNVWSTVELGGVHTRGQLVTDWDNKKGNHTNVRIVKKFDIEVCKEMYMAMVK